jgi:hypothetical protein
VPREERDGAVHKGHTGTLRWMAPEVLGKMSRYTEKVRGGQIYNPHWHGADCLLMSQCSL